MPWTWIAVGVGGLLVVLAGWLFRSSPMEAPAATPPVAIAPAPPAAPVEPTSQQVEPAHPDMAAALVDDLMGGHAPTQPVEEAAPVVDVPAAPATRSSETVEPATPPAKPASTPAPRQVAKPTPKPEPQVERQWQDDALDQLDQLEKRL